MRALARAFSASLVALVLALAGGARADTVPLSALPVAKIPRRPKELPARPAHGRTIAEVATPQPAWSGGPWVTTERSKAPACMEVEDPTGRTSITSVFGVTSELAPFRVLRLVEEGGKVSLDVVDGWLDPIGNVPRELSHARVELARVASSPLGFDVYAYRTGHEAVFLVPSHGALSYREPSPAENGDGEPIATSDCGFVRLRLDTARKEGASAMAFDVSPAAWPREDHASKPAHVWISASVSRVARDPEPRLSISWRGFER